MQNPLWKVVTMVDSIYAEVMHRRVHSKKGNPRWSQLLFLVQFLWQGNSQSWRIWWWRHRNGPAQQNVGRHGHGKSSKKKTADSESKQEPASISMSLTCYLVFPAASNVACPRGTYCAISTNDFEQWSSTHGHPSVTPALTPAAPHYRPYPSW